MLHTHSVHPLARPGPVPVLGLPADGSRRDLRAQSVLVRPAAHKDLPPRPSSRASQRPRPASSYASSVPSSSINYSEDFASAEGARPPGRGRPKKGDASCMGSASSLAVAA